jgi:hypothetical protein
MSEVQHKFQAEHTSAFQARKVRLYCSSQYLAIDWAPNKTTEALVKVAQSLGLGPCDFGVAVDYWCWKMAGRYVQFNDDGPDDDEFDAYRNAVRDEAEQLSEDITRDGVADQIAFLWLYDDTDLRDLQRVYDSRQRQAAAA